MLYDHNNLLENIIRAAFKIDSPLVKYDELYKRHQLDTMEHNIQTKAKTIPMNCL